MCGFEFLMMYGKTFRNVYSVSYLTKTLCLFHTKISRVIKFREIIIVYSENDKKPINNLCGENSDI